LAGSSLSTPRCIGEGGAEELAVFVQVIKGRPRDPSAVMASMNRPEQSEWWTKVT
jgi:hypothetical protein